ncbi:MAG: hypothetical protein GY839_12775 [candidate division Zixibacteria bacterium]|nr:hypothetical protein [candidate division Zixibacteria bacterium]
MDNKQEKNVERIVGKTGFEVQVTLSNPELQPKFRPVIEKISTAIRETTGTVCSEEVVARLRW